MCVCVCVYTDWKAYVPAALYHTICIYIWVDLAYFRNAQTHHFYFDDDVAAESGAVTRFRSARSKDHHQLCRHITSSSSSSLWTRTLVVQMGLLKMYIYNYLYIHTHYTHICMYNIKLSSCMLKLCERKKNGVWTKMPSTSVNARFFSKVYLITGFFSFKYIFV